MILCLYRIKKLPTCVRSLLIRCLYNQYSMVLGSLSSCCVLEDSVLAKSSLY